MSTPCDPYIKALSDDVTELKEGQRELVRKVEQLLVRTVRVEVRASLIGVIAGVATSIPIALALAAMLR